VYLATGLSQVDRPEAHHEEADMQLQWFPLTDAVRKVFGGEIVNAIAVAGLLAAHAVAGGFATPRPIDSPWTDRPTAFTARRDR
ncbi:NUDIX hydrolase, partial [Mycobacterium sp. THU-M116]